MNITNTQVIVVTGPPRAGKDTVMGYIRMHSKSHVLVTSMVNPAKELMEKAGLWNENNKTPKSRECLFKLKNLLDEYYDYSKYKLLDTIKIERDNLDNAGYDFYPMLVLVCSKEIDDIKYLKEEYNAKVVCVYDDGVRSGQLQISNDADKIFEKLVNSELVDYYIDNSKDLETLNKNVIETFKKMGVEF